jgi:hypothetical protein
MAQEMKKYKVVVVTTTKDTYEVEAWSAAHAKDKMDAGETHGVTKLDTNVEKKVVKRATPSAQG